MKLISRATIILVSLFYFSSCMQSDDPVWYFFDEPAIVAYNDKSAILKTSFGPYPAPELDNEGLAAGQCLISNFILDYAQNPLVASAITYVKVYNSPIQIQAGELLDTFTDSIGSAQLLAHNVDTTLFFSFTAYKSTPANTMFQYELICNTDSTKEMTDKSPIYSLYLKSKIVPSGGAVNVQNKYYYAFDIKDFVKRYENKDGVVNINLYYKSQERKGGDVYTPLKDNPITLKFNKM